MKYKTIQITLVCPICENKVTIFRRVAKQKKFGHRKWLYCWKCQKLTNHFEIRDYKIEEERLSGR
jgi:uncharacterized protein YbaR (Trm112 family)